MLKILLSFLLIITFMSSGLAQQLSYEVVPTRNSLSRNNLEALRLYSISYKARYGVAGYKKFLAPGAAVQITSLVIADQCRKIHSRLVQISK
jgi:hypothetical protein